MGGEIVYRCPVPACVSKRGRNVDDEAELPNISEKGEGEGRGECQIPGIEATGGAYSPYPLYFLSVVKLFLPEFGAVFFFFCGGEQA